MTKKKKHPAFGFSLIIEAFLLCAASIAFVLFVVHFNFTQDDAYITFRYAENFIDGHGLVYNIGDRVEGYTNFLWTIFMILGRLAGLDYILFSKILGTAFGLGTIVLLFFMMRYIVREMPPLSRSLLPGIASVLLGTTYSFAYWAVAGLETAAFGFFVLLAFHCYSRRSMMLIPALVLATLMRPEGGLVFVFLLIYDLTSQRKWTPHLTAITSLYILFLLPYAFFKIGYYGSILPNSFYAKTGLSFQRIVYGLDYVWSFCRYYLAYGLFIIPIILALRKTAAAIRVCLIFLAVYIIYIILIGGDVLKVHRFFMPVYPLIIISVVWSFYTLIRKRHLYLIALIVFLAGQVTLPRNHVEEFHTAETGLITKMTAMTDNLRSVDSTNFSLAVSTIGLVGYRLMGHTVIDMLGLTDSTIARHSEAPVEGMETTWRETRLNTAYLLSRQPDYILFSTDFKPSAPAERDLFLHSAFLKSYRTVGFFFKSALHSIFKRFLPIDAPIRRDVDVRFVQSFHRGLNLLLNESRNREALEAFGRAGHYLGDPAYPYLDYYSSIAYGQMGDFDRPRLLLKKIIDRDSLVYEAYMGLTTLACAAGDRDDFLAYRAHLARLAPWYIPRLDSMCAPLLMPDRP